jgi:hypothetical protein
VSEVIPQGYPMRLAQATREYPADYGMWVIGWTCEAGRESHASAVLADGTLVPTARIREGKYVVIVP